MKAVKSYALEAQSDLRSRIDAVLYDDDSMQFEFSCDAEEQAKENLPLPTAKIVEGRSVTALRLSPHAVLMLSTIIEELWKKRE